MHEGTRYNLRALVHVSTGRLAEADASLAPAHEQAVADMLHVSVRTVENRLQRAFEKLGVSGRRALGEALEEYVE